MKTKPVEKGVLDSYLLTPAQRAEYYRLLTLGFPEVQARTMAQALKKSAESGGWEESAMVDASPGDAGDGPWDALAKSGYHARFVAEAKNALHGFKYQEIHDKARRAAGGTASGVSRRASKSPEGQDSLEWLKFLQAELKQAELAVSKSMPTRSEVHVDRPLSQDRSKLSVRIPKASVTGEDGKKVKKFGQGEGLAMDTTGHGGLPQGPESAKLNALRLVSGIDYYLGNGTEDVEEARTMASRGLARDMGSFDNLFQADSDIRNLPGLDVDLGCGANRQVGHLGLDLVAYDHGTAVFDISQLPLPFDDGEVRSYRMFDVPLQGIDATRLLQEVQRTLTYGGTFTCALSTDLSLAADMAQVPGLRVEAPQYATPLEDDTGMVRQVFTRVRARLPWVYGADTQWLHQQENSVMDIVVNNVLGVPNHTFAGQAMANLLTKSNSFGLEAKIVKAQKMRKIVTSVVYAPDELDTDEEWMNAEDIENAAHNFLIDGGYIGSEHGGKPIGADVVESYIAPCDLVFDGPFGRQDVPKGAWIMSVKIRSEDEWAKVLSGDYTGFSVGGYAMR